jgi:hypothetical protein
LALFAVAANGRGNIRDPLSHDKYAEQLDSTPQSEAKTFYSKIDNFAEKLDSFSIRYWDDQTYWD